MIRKRRLGFGLTFLAAAALLATVFATLASAGKSGPAAAAALSGTIERTKVGANEAVKVTIKNSGPESYVAIRVTLKGGVKHTGAGIDKGGSCGPGVSDVDVRCNLTEPLAPGETRVVTITVDRPYPDGVGADLWCQTTAGGAFSGPVSVPGPTPTAPPPPPPPPPPPTESPCECEKLTVKLDPTLLNKAPRLRPDKHDFGVGFQWFLTCSAGKGTCMGQVHFLPPEILAGTLPKPKQNLHLNIKRATVTCGPTPCAKSTTGRFEIKMLSREQLNKLFGRTLAYTLVLRCGKNEKEIQVKVLVDKKGRLTKRR